MDCGEVSCKQGNYCPRPSKVHPYTLHLPEGPPRGLESTLAAGSSLLTGQFLLQAGSWQVIWGLPGTWPILELRWEEGGRPPRCPYLLLDLGKPLAPQFLYLLLGMTSVP